MSRTLPDWYFTRDSVLQVQSLTDLKAWVKWQACIPEANFSHFGLFFLSSASPGGRWAAAGAILTAFGRRRGPQGALGSS